MKMNKGWIYPPSVIVSKTLLTKRCTCKVWESRIKSAFCVVLLYVGVTANIQGSLSNGISPLSVCLKREDWKIKNQTSFDSYLWFGRMRVKSVWHIDIENLQDLSIFLSHIQVTINKIVGGCLWQLWCFRYFFKAITSLYSFWVRPFWVTH